MDLNDDDEALALRLKALDLRVANAKADRQELVDMTNRRGLGLSGALKRLRRHQMSRQKSDAPDPLLETPVHTPDISHREMGDVPRETAPYVLHVVHYKLGVEFDIELSRDRDGAEVYDGATLHLGRERTE